LPLVGPRVVFTPAARAELTDPQHWYEREAPGLGRRFRLEIERTVRRMTNNHLQFPVRFKTLRRARVHNFPYSLFFSIDADTLIVIACFRGSRDPQHWHRRA
jgi:plasmid stabilization system protein ParE